MEVLQDGLIAFFSAVGITALIWLTVGAMLRGGKCAPKGLILILPLRGDAENLENDLREMRRLQNQIPGMKIVLADCGMTEDARRLTQYLADREKHTELVNQQEFHLG